MPDTRGQAVIIGAGPGLGRSLALRVSRDGHPVALIGRRLVPLAALADEVANSGGMATTVEADAADPHQISAAVQKVGERGSIEVIVYNAAMFAGPLTTSDLSTLHSAMDVNVNSAIVAVQAGLPYLRASQGSVLLTGGGLAVQPNSAAGGLSVGKAAFADGRRRG